MHQLRGRIGRGAAKSYCVLMTGGKVSIEAQQRLDAMVRTQNGFEIAELDLQQRGPGEFFGTRQAGMPNFRVANLLRDRDLLEAARKEARYVLAGPNADVTKDEIAPRRAASAQPLEPALWIGGSGIGAAGRSSPFAIRCSPELADRFSDQLHGVKLQALRIQVRKGAFMLDPKEILTTLSDRFATTGKVQNVFGEPIEAHGRTIIPVAKLNMVWAQAVAARTSPAQEDAVGGARRRRRREGHARRRASR